ncbi:MAG: metalloregulator ArsR/SmtB family transcription factor [Dehalococcoidia bacterium]
MEKDKLIFELQAEMLGVLSNPKRLRILKVLGKKEKTVGEIASQVGIELQNASQHLRIMKAHGIVLARRDGHAVYYRLATPVIADCCELVGQAIMENLENRRNLLAKG